MEADIEHAHTPSTGSAAILPLADYRTVEYHADGYHADRLAGAPTTLGEPHSRHPRGAVRELRFHLSRSTWRASY